MTATAELESRLNRRAGRRLSGASTVLWLILPLLALEGLFLGYPILRGILTSVEAPAAASPSRTSGCC